LHMFQNKKRNITILSFDSFRRCFSPKVQVSSRSSMCIYIDANVMRSQLRYRPKSIIYYTQFAEKSKVFFAYSPENAGG